MKFWQSTLTNMTDLSLNILDIAQNSIKAEAKFIQIYISADTEKDQLEITITDDGCGMTEDQLNKVTDPFYTTRTTRKVGLGIPFYKMAAELSGGGFSIESKLNEGTTSKAWFKISNIDRPPLGDISETIATLVIFNPDIDFLYSMNLNGNCFELNTKEMREILEGIPFNTHEVASYIREYLRENTATVLNGNYL
jgi:hypothetical protein